MSASLVGSEMCIRDRKKPGKPLDVQLDELADMLAFGLSIANQVGVSSEAVSYTHLTLPTTERV
ncbi:hypothetical protein JMUB7545_27720 [Staphylococcus aureus]